MTNCVDALASLLLENKKKLEESQLLRQQKFPPSTIVIIVYIVTQYLFVQRKLLIWLVRRSLYKIPDDEATSFFKKHVN